MKGKLARKAAKNSSSIFINRDQKISGGVQGEARDIAAMRVWQSARFVTDDVKTIYALKEVKIVIIYLMRSKIVTRFPTGERRHVPSCVKSRFPLQ